MYSYEDLERFYFRNQTEALPHGQSLQSFCLNNNVLTHSTQQLISFWKRFRCSNGSYSIICTVKLHGSSVWSYLGDFFKKSLRVAEIIIHSYPLVSDQSSPQCEFTIDFLTKSIKVGTKKCLLFGVCPKLTAYNQGLNQKEVSLLLNLNH